MYTKQMMERSVKHYTKNKHWKEYYETAPSEECKEMIAFDFCFSDNGDEGYFEDLADFKAENAKLEAKLGIEDWKHLLKYCGNNPLRVKYRKMIEKLQAEQNT